jgi:putative transposase
VAITGTTRTAAARLKRRCKVPVKVPLCLAEVLGQIARDLRPVYTAATEAEAWARFKEFAEKWGRAYPAITKLWQNAWAGSFGALLRRSPLCSHPHRHLPAQAAPASASCCDNPQVQVFHLHSNSSASRRTKPALNAFAVTFEGRIPTR